MLCFCFFSSLVSVQKRMSCPPEMFSPGSQSSGTVSSVTSPLSLPQSPTGANIVPVSCRTGKSLVHESMGQIAVSNWCGGFTIFFVFNETEVFTLLCCNATVYLHNQIKCYSLKLVMLDKILIWNPHFLSSVLWPQI